MYYFMRYRFILYATAFVAQFAYGSSGPEYLEAESQQHPLLEGFKAFRLPWVEERRSQLTLRSFYFNRDTEGRTIQEDMALGGTFNVVSVYWNGHLKLGATAYTSQKLYADSDKADTGLLQDGHQSFSGASEFYTGLMIEKLTVEAGRFAVNMPYINRSDIRMIPQTFQGFRGNYRISDKWIVGAGMLTHIKNRTSTGFDDLYQKAGLREAHTISGAGSIYTPKEGRLAGVYWINAPDYKKDLYLEISERYPYDDDRYIQLSAQYTHQESIGSQLDGEFSVDHFGLRVSWNQNWAKFTMAYTYYSNTDQLRSPWGSIPGYTSVMVKDFNRPGEKAWLLGTRVNWIGLVCMDSNLTQNISLETPLAVAIMPARIRMNLI